ncbi:trans-1,2-dihydrobenzene-1,2-diol dehydrogenase-like [Paramacrobiotus metropolitanus]|uniref:trans-1,2-dihydrobenzene-1,2-diol dehydrogenase-like n=1 Tax=Paramacrobiotus metropolitanus TaxID=2943436 RepID=UPI002445CC2C|nr:trans-1,2-dihydrobenzene-1,2-diol dehydrogenase-like [Paramacrobiotus metropolitanus]
MSPVPNKTLRWGIAGSGRICNDFVVAMMTLPKDEHEVVAVASRHEFKAQEFASRLSIRKFYGSYEALAKDPEVDVVYIGAINTEHKKLCLMMLQHDKHVLCEKPLTLRLAESKELFDYARKKGKFLMEAIWTRCFPAYKQLREEILKQSIGPVQLLTANFGFHAPNVPNLAERDLGGGILLNVGCYVVQLANLVFQDRKPATVKAVATFNESGVDHTTAITLQYDDGAIAQFLVSMLTDLESTARIVGKEGLVIEIGAPFLAPTQLKTPSEEFHYKLPFVDEKFPLNFINSSGLAFEADEVRRCILAGKTESPLMSEADSLLSAEIIDAICKEIRLNYD